MKMAIVLLLVLGGILVLGVIAAAVIVIAFTRNRKN